MLLLVAAGLSVVLPSQPVVLGGAAVEVWIDGARGTPEVRTNIGRVTAPVAAGGGRWRFEWTPPAEQYPQVAMFAVWDDKSAQLGVLPVPGAGTLAVEVDAKDAEVSLQIGERRFAGHTDSDGRTTIPFLAPPGASVGQVGAADRLGNVKVKVVPLGIPDVPRVLVFATPPRALADGATTVRVLAFAATPEGRPDPSLAFADAAASSPAPGVLMLELPPRAQAGEQTIAARTTTGHSEIQVRWDAMPGAAVESERRLHWRAGVTSTANLGHVIANGALVGAEGRRSRLALFAEAGASYATGSVPGDMPATDASFWFVAFPIRVGAEADLSARANWQPYAGVHAGIELVRSSADARANAVALPPTSETELAADVGAELGVRYRIGAGALVFSVGWQYAPVVSGQLLSGSLAGLTETIGYRR